MMNQLPQPPLQPPFPPSQGQSPQPHMGQSSMLLSNIPKIVGFIIFIILMWPMISHYLSPAPNPTNDSSPTATPIPAKVGDTITIDDISSTLISVTDVYAPGYTTINFTLDNKSSSEYSYYASDFHIITSSGNIIDPEETGSGALAPGGHGNGMLNFKIYGLHNAKLLWQPVGHSNDLSHVWNFVISSDIPTPTITSQ